MAIRVLICAAVVLAVSTVSVEGKADGAPDAVHICESLTPKHGSSKAQNGAAPFDFKQSTTTTSAGGSVTITVSQQPGGPSIKGFMFQARKVGLAKPEGEWKAAAGESKTMMCGGNGPVSLTHSNARERNSVEATWVAPGPGQYEILQTVVQDFYTFWVAEKSRVITVQ